MKNIIEYELNNLTTYILNFIKSNQECFLPNKSPIRNLRKEYDFLSLACKELASKYHGENKNCREFITDISEEIPVSFNQDLANINLDEIEAIMTRVSILAHAYRWEKMPAKKESYNINKVSLPNKLNELWQALAKRLEIPPVGNFYSIISNNWHFTNLEYSKNYNSNNVSLDNVSMLFNWLEFPQKDELNTFVITALYIEAQGKRIITSILKIYNGFLNQNMKDSTN